jgi:tripartite-type tricarboxylate transporter receptor subunit TctC
LRALSLTLSGVSMTLSRRTFLTALASTPLAALLPRPAFAAYPDKPIRLIVPFAAGGNADLVARIVGEAMSPSLGQPIVVETRTGAGGSIGAAAVANATPDGYTLLTGSNGPLTVNPFVQAKLPYDPLKDFVPIGLANLAPHSIVLNNSVQVKTLAELIELSKKQQVTLGTAGVGSASHMTLARFNAATGAKFVHVPYRGGGALVPDVLAGTVSGAMTEVSTLLAHHGQGKVRIFAVASAKRLARLPDVPTMIESGVKDFTAASYVGVLAPAKTPPDVVATLEKALVKALADKSAQEKFIASGAELVPDNLQTSKGFAGYIAKEYENSKEAAQLAGLKPE